MNISSYCACYFRQSIFEDFSIFPGEAYLIGFLRNYADYLELDSAEVVGLYIFKKAYIYLKFGPATAMAWVLAFMLIGFTIHQLRILSRLEFRTTGDKE